jgi:hypothetical protein
METSQIGEDKRKSGANDHTRHTTPRDAAGGDRPESQSRCVP